MKPVVFVTSYGDIDATQIIKSILGECNEEQIVDKILIESEYYTAYFHNIKTKYYDNTIALVPIAANALTSHPELSRIADAMIVFFEPHNKLIKNDISTLSNLIKANNINLGLLLTSKLFEDSTLGLTYEEVKKGCMFEFDVIELCKERNDKSAISCVEYDYGEVIEALQNHVWSNIKYPQSNTSEENEFHSNTLEDDLENFEALLTSIQTFKRVSSTLERDEVINQAEKLAELFAKIINED